MSRPALRLRLGSLLLVVSTGALAESTAVSVAPVLTEAARAMTYSVEAQLLALDEMIALQDQSLAELLAEIEATTDQVQRAQFTAAAERRSEALDALEDQRNQMAAQLEKLKAALAAATQPTYMTGNAP
jgi:hypothetical protein